MKGENGASDPTQRRRAACESAGAASHEPQKRIRPLLDIALAALTVQFTPGKSIEVMTGNKDLHALELMLFGAIPTWPHSRSWGYRPSAALGIILLVLLILLLTGRL